MLIEVETLKLEEKNHPLNNLCRNASQAQG